jgi:hypothetical protein
MMGGLDVQAPALKADIFTESGLQLLPLYFSKNAVHSTCTQTLDIP